MSYTKYGAREVWHFTHTQSIDNLLDNWVTAVRERDGTTMNFTLNFDEFDEDEGEDEEAEDLSIDLICVLGSTLLFRVFARGFKVFNLCTMTSRNIPYPFAGEMHPEIALLGTRMITDPVIQWHYIVAFYNQVNRNDGLRFHFFSYQSRVGFQPFPQMAFSNPVDNLTFAEFNHPLGMVMPVNFMDTLAFLSMRDNQPVHMVQENVVFDDDVVGALEQPLQNLGPEFDDKNEIFLSNNGFALIVDTREVEIQHLWYGMIQRMTLFSVRTALGDGVPEIISVVPNELIPNDFAVFRSHRLMVMEGAVNFTFQCISIQGRWDIVILRYDIETHEWTRRRIARPEGHGMFGATISTRLGITPV